MSYDQMSYDQNTTWQAVVFKRNVWPSVFPIRRIDQHINVDAVLRAGSMRALELLVHQWMASNRPGYSLQSTFQRKMGGLLGPVASRYFNEDADAQIIWMTPMPTRDFRPYEDPVMLPAPICRAL